MSSQTPLLLVLDPGGADCRGTVPDQPVALTVWVNPNPAAALPTIPKLRRKWDGLTLVYGMLALSILAAAIQILKP